MLKTHVVRKQKKSAFDAIALRAVSCQLLVLVGSFAAGAIVTSRF